MSDTQATTTRLRYGGASYLDKTRALEVGEIVPLGCTLDYTSFEHVGELFRTVVQDPEAFDVAEMSLSTLVMLASRGDRRLVGIPVFPSKAFRHSQVYVHAGSGVQEPRDLVGRTVGVPEYQMTAAVWIRAFLQHDYGVAPSDLRWVTGGLHEPRYQERLHHAPPPGVSLELIPGDTTLLELLDDGRIAALVTAQQPQPFTAGTGRVRRLFPDYRAVEEDYLRRTGYFPIMHTVVLRRPLYEQRPSLALRLLEAFEASKAAARARIRNLDRLELKEPFSAYGGDPFAYGIPRNRHVLEALLDYSFEQGLSDRRVEVEELFAPETHEWNPPPAADEAPA
jgi:4,5-dihydroxyphthalate decarboxylase